jgi:hypothetical protein
MVYNSPRVGERCSKEALCELLEQLDDPEAGITFQSQVEHVLLGDIRAYQNRLLASNDELKCRVIDWITSTLPHNIPNSSGVRNFRRTGQVEIGSMGSN